MSKFDERIPAVVSEIAAVERARLNATQKDRPWWGDVVFLMHDLKTIGQLMHARGVTDGAEALAEVIAKSTFQLLAHLGVSTEQATVMMKELMDASNALDEKLDDAALNLRITIAAEELGIDHDL